MRINNFKRIIKEDYSEEDQELIDKLAFSINPLMEQLSNVFNKGIDFENLNQQVVTFEVELSSGKPKAATQLSVSLRTKPIGLVVIRAENLSLNGTFPTAAPFITYGISNNNLVVNHVAGIPDNTRYRLTAIVYG